MDFQGSLDNRSACISGSCLHHIGRTCSERWLKIEDCIEEFGEGKLSMSTMLYLFMLRHFCWRVSMRHIWQLLKHRCIVGLPMYCQVW